MWSRRRKTSAIADRPDRALVRLYWPADLRAAFDALFAIDGAMAEVVATTSEPTLGAIRLAWWRERLQELDDGKVPAEPRLQVVERELLPRAISGAELAALEDGWLPLFEPFPWNGETAKAIAARGRRLFSLAARLLGADDPRAEQAGAIWALVDVARHCSDAASRQALVEQSREPGKALAGHRFEYKLRPLTMLAALARRDVRRGEPFEAEGTPGRALALLRHRFTGGIG